MAERTPKPTTVKTAWVRSHPFPLSTSVEDREAEFDRMIAAVERAAAVKALRAEADWFFAPLWDGTPNGRAYNSYRVAELLRESANRIESEEQA